jgi:hypothetical protein
MDKNKGLKDDTFGKNNVCAGIGTDGAWGKPFSWDEADTSNS